MEFLSRSDQGAIGRDVRDGPASGRLDLHDVVAARLQADGQRYTRSRRSLIEILAGAGRPLSIPEILAAEPALPQSSAYRNLVVLEQAGAVGRILTADSARYELGEGLVAHHHHVVCLSCSSVADVTLPSRVERAIDVATDEVTGSTGFRAMSHRLEIIGVCAVCAAG